MPMDKELSEFFNKTIIPFPKNLVNFRFLVWVGFEVLVELRDALLVHRAGSLAGNVIDNYVELIVQIWLLHCVRC